MNLMWLFHAPRSLQGLSENSVGTLRELCGHSLGPLRELSGNPKGQKPMVCARLSRFFARRMSAFRDGKVIAKQWKWRAKVWESIEKGYPETRNLMQRLPRKLLFWTNLGSCVVMFGWYFILLEVTLHGNQWIQDDFSWRWGDLFVLLELPGNSAGIPGKLQKPKIHDLRKGFRVFGKVHDFVMEKWP